MRHRDMSMLFLPPHSSSIYLPGLFFFFHTNYIFTFSFTVNLSSTQPLPPSLRIEIIWTVCSPPALLYPSFPSSPPWRPAVLPQISPPTLLISHPLFSLALVDGLWGPSSTPEVICNLVSEEPFQATRAHIGQLHTQLPGNATGNQPSSQRLRSHG